MNRDAAIAEAQRLRLYFPYRLHGIAKPAIGDDASWFNVAGRTMARFNNLLRKGFIVEMLKSK